ncbi:MAG: hypothetical protein V4556_04910 [Bacteroidota bacterium]
MKQQKYLTIPVLFFTLLIGCSKKHQPQTVENVPEKSAVIIKTKKTPVPKFIIVNDAVAKKTPDGRLYYDLEGKRYWKNYDDGKYYLYNKAMFENKSFKPH